MCFLCSQVIIVPCAGNPSITVSLKDGPSLTPQAEKLQPKWVLLRFESLKHNGLVFCTFYSSNVDFYWINDPNFSYLKVEVNMSVPEKGSWKTSLTFAMQKFKNNIQRCINVSVRAMGKTTNTMTSKAHYAIFVEGGQLVDGTHAFFFSKTTAWTDQTFRSATISLSTFCQSIRWKSCVGLAEKCFKQSTFDQRKSKKKKKNT